MPRIFRIATRKSKMAMTQTERAVKLLQAAHTNARFEIVSMTSDGCYEKYKGDLSLIGGKGAFVKALELAMLANDADIAMHSMKDVPTDGDIPDGLIIPYISEREDVRDAAVCRQGESLAALKPGSKIGTSSVRRAAQLKRNMPHLEIVPLRGNADTRVGKVDSGEVDAAILAYAGLRRIGLQERVTDVFEPDLLLPAVGQGSVGLECRAEDQEVVDMLQNIAHQESFAQVTAERTMLMGLGGSCHTPIAGLCTTEDEKTLTLTGLVSSLDGLMMVRATKAGPADDPEKLGQQVAQDLLSQGAREILDACEQAA
jgi:hydroxymethylbilane synthase